MVDKHSPKTRILNGIYLLSIQKIDHFGFTEITITYMNYSVNSDFGKKCETGDRPNLEGILELIFNFGQIKRISVKPNHNILI